MIRSSTTLELVTGKYVEPVLLQVVCATIWERLSSKSIVPEPTGDGTSRITPGMIPQENEISRALGDFYDRIVGKISHRFNRVLEARTRQWFEDDLTDGLLR